MDVQLRINDIDFLGHLNNTVYLSLFDTAKAGYFSQITRQPISGKNVGTVIVNVNCDFYAPTLYDEPCAIMTACSGVGTRSFSLEQRMVNTATGQVKCICRTVMAGFDPVTMQGADLRPEWVSALEEYEQRPLRRNR